MKRAISHPKELKWVDGFDTRSKFLLEKYGAPYEMVPEDGAAREYSGTVGAWHDGVYCLNAVQCNVPGGFSAGFLIPSVGVGPHQRVGMDINWKRLQLDVQLAPRILPTAELIFSGPERVRFLLVHSLGGTEPSGGLLSGYERLPFFGDILQSTRVNPSTGALEKFAYSCSKQNHSNDRLFKILRDEWRTINCHPDIEFPQGLPEYFIDQRHGSFSWDVDLSGLTHTAYQVNSTGEVQGFGGGDLILIAVSTAQYENLGVPGTHVNWSQVQFYFNYRLYFEDN